MTDSYVNKEYVVRLEALVEQLEAELTRLREAIDEMEKAYPSDIFTEPTPDDFAYIHKVRGLSERLHGSWARHLVEVIRRRA